MRRFECTLFFGGCKGKPAGRHQLFKFDHLERNPNLYYFDSAKFAPAGIPPISSPDTALQLAVRAFVPLPSAAWVQRCVGRSPGCAIQAQMLTPMTAAVDLCTATSAGS